LNGPELFLPADRISRLRRSVQQVLGELKGTLLERVGNTPLVRIKRVQPESKVRVYAKVEGCNPSGSIKDRIALYMLADALTSGAFKPEGSMLEASSGNTGIALSMIGAQLGLRVVITVPDNVSVERHKIIDAYGARPLLTSGERGTLGAVMRARELVQENGNLLWLAQHYNEVNSFAHYETTAAEIVAQLAQAGEKRLDAFVASSGTTGTLMGSSARLKETFPHVEVVAVWPADKIMGIRKPEGENRPSIYREALIDRVFEVTNQAANDMVAKVATLEGLLLGPSGGAAVAGALDAAARLEEREGGGVVVVVIPDWGERYLSMDGFRPTYGRRATDRPGQPLRRRSDASSGD
jgi:cysteine synthase